MRGDGGRLGALAIVVVSFMVTNFILNVLAPVEGSTSSIGGVQSAATPSSDSERTINLLPLLVSPAGWGPGYALAAGNGPGFVIGPGPGSPNVFAQALG
jgi:hypothetical protein